MVEKAKSGGRERICMQGDVGLQFVDTNVLVYAYDISAGRKHEVAKELLK